MDYVIGVDVGGTKMAAGLMDRQARILARQVTHAHAGCPPDSVVEVLLQTVQSLLASAGMAKEEIAGVGVGSPGHIDMEHGIVLTNSNLPGWDSYPLTEILRKRLGLPVVLDNDANCAAWAEFRYGAGRGSRHMCYVTFSTGFGMGIIIAGRLYRGATGTAGEIGHTVVDPDGPRCSCGKRGCLMCYACGMALDRMARDCIDCGESTQLKELCGECPEHVPAERIAEAAAHGDPAAIRLLELAGRYFGIGLANVVQILNPDTIVIGGGLAHIGPPLLDPCLQAMNENIDPALAGSARIVISELWEQAGMIGAGALIWEQAE